MLGDDLQRCISQTEQDVAHHIGEIMERLCHIEESTRTIMKALNENVQIT